MGRAFEPVLRQGAANSGARHFQGEDLARCGWRTQSGCHDDDFDRFSANADCQVIQAMAKESGFDIRIQAIEFTSAQQHAANGDFESFLWGGGGRIDPDGNISPILGCNAALNYQHYCNPEVDRELDAARTLNARADRLAHYRIVAEHILQDLPIIYLYHQKWLFAYTAKLSGFTPYPDGFIRPQGLRLD